MSNSASAPVEIARKRRDNPPPTPARLPATRGSAGLALCVEFDFGLDDFKPVALGVDSRIAALIALVERQRLDAWRQNLRCLPRRPRPASGRQARPAARPATSSRCRAGRTPGPPTLRIARQFAHRQLIDTALMTAVESGRGPDRQRHVRCRRGRAARSRSRDGDKRDHRPHRRKQQNTRAGERSVFHRPCRRPRPRAGPIRLAQSHARFRSCRRRSSLRKPAD